MSNPILPFAMWESGTNQNSVPANDNSLRNQILGGLIISAATDAQPGSPANGDAYIMTGAATGAQWGTFDQFDLAIFDSGTWYAFAPVEGVTVNLAGALVAWDGAAYVAVGGGSVSGSTITYDTAAIASGAIDLSDETVGVWLVSLTANVTAITLPTALSGEALSIIVLFTQDGTGGRTVAGWPTTVWESGSAPTITSTAGATTSVPLLILGNGTIYGVS